MIIYISSSHATANAMSVAAKRPRKANLSYASTTDKKMSRKFAYAVQYIAIKWKPIKWKHFNLPNGLLLI